MALLLVLAMALALAAPVWASEEVPAESILSQEASEPEEEENSAEPSEQTQSKPEESAPEQETSGEKEQKEEKEAAKDEAAARPQESPEAERAPEESAPAQKASEAEEQKDSAPAAKEQTEERTQQESLNTQTESELPDVEDDKDLISSKEAFVRVDKTKTVKLKNQPKAEAYFVSKNTKVVSVNKTGESLKLTGVSVGKAKVEMRRSADNALLDTITVYGFRPAETSQATGTRYKPGDLTVSGSGIPTRVYDLTCQKAYDGKSYGDFMRHHGCTVCSATSACSAYGNDDVTMEWLMCGGMEEIALRSGITPKEDKTLGYYGMQQVLAYAGISSKVYNWKNKDTANVEAAKEELVTALSAGRPVLIFTDKVPNGSWKGKVGTLYGGPHCVTLVGINSSGKLLIVNSIYPQGINTFKYKGKVQKLEITPGELIDYFVRHSKMKRTKQDDFYYTKAGGWHSFLEVTCDKAREIKRTSILDIGVKLEKTSYTYTGKAITPKVTIGSLKEGTDFKVACHDNTKVGTAYLTVVGLGDYSGFTKKEFTIKRAAGSITASDKTITASTKQQEVDLGASAKGGASLSFTSSDAAVSVSDKGVVTIPGGYVGSVVITINSAQTAGYKAASKAVTVTVEPNQELLEKGKLLVSDRRFRQSTKDRLVPLNPVAQEGTVFTYTSEDKAVKVSEEGVVTIPKEYVGVAKVKVTASIPVVTATGTDTPAEGETVIESRTVKITIEPRRVVSFSLKAEKGKKVTVKWKKANKVNGFQISYKCNGKKKSVTLNKGSATSLKLTGLKQGKSCEVRIRSYAKINGTTLWSGWSNKKSVKVKK